VTFATGCLQYGRSARDGQNVSVEVTVTDTQTGIIRRYDNPLNAPFQSVQDLSAFTCS